MSKKFTYKILIFLTITLLFTSSTFIVNAGEQPAKVTVSIISPNVIRSAEEFTIVAAVTNEGNGQDAKLKTSKWKYSKNLEKNKLSDKLTPASDSKETIIKLRDKKDKTENDIESLKKNYEKYKKGTKYLKLKVTKEMAQEIIDKGSLKVGLEIESQNSFLGSNQTTQNEVEITSAQLPQKPIVAPGAHHSDWYFGDTHSHSTYTSDYIIGDGIYTIPELKSLAKVAGLDWLTLTDHAYCLNETKFNTIKNTVTSLSDSQFAFLYGEELSAAELVNGTKSSDTCHYNGIMNDKFVSCSTNFLRKASSPTSQQGIDNLKNANGLVTINHPNLGTGTFESWNFSLKTYPYTRGETGIEVINASMSNTANKGSATRWIDQRLLKGQKVFPFAGSDTESKNHLGECYTVVYADYLTQSDIKTNLSNGHQYVTTGPGLALWLRQIDETPWSWMGDTKTLSNLNCEFNLSFNDANNDCTIYIMQGKNGWTSEKCVYTKTFSKGSTYINIPMTLEKDSYYRAYCESTTNSSIYAYTTPIWTK